MAISQAVCTSFKQELLVGTHNLDEQKHLNRRRSRKSTILFVKKVL